MSGRGDVNHSAQGSAIDSHAYASEAQPLIKHMPQQTMSNACYCAMGAVLVFLWCTFDKLNRGTADELFGYSSIENISVDDVGAGRVTGDVKYPFQFPLMLALFQFAFMGLIFLGIWWMLTKDATYDVAKIRENLFSTTWASLTVTHVFSTFWLQSLMMPGHMMSLGVFAASRAVEVPAAAALRSTHIGTGARFGGHPLATTALASAAAWLLTYSYSQISECLCIWSGHGVELAGVALFCIYALVLVLPAANAVCLETVMVRFNTNPLLMLGAVNILACILLAPVLFFAHLAGWEDIALAMQVTTRSREIYMLVIWLCIQMSLMSAVGIALISVTDSFWAVSLQSLRPVYWWTTQLLFYYFFSEEVLSIARPNASFWGFIMLCGMCLMGMAMVVDQDAKTAKDGEAPNGFAWGLTDRQFSSAKGSEV